MNESLVLKNPRSDGWPGKQPDQKEDEATMAPNMRSRHGRDTVFASLGLSTPADFEGGAGSVRGCTGTPAGRDGFSPLDAGSERPRAPPAWPDSPALVTARRPHEADDTVDGKDALLELMAKELAALKRQIAEL